MAGWLSQDTREKKYEFTPSSHYGGITALTQNWAKLENWLRMIRVPVEPTKYLFPISFPVPVCVPQTTFSSNTKTFYFGSEGPGTSLLLQWELGLSLEGLPSFFCWLYGLRIIPALPPS